MRTLDLLASDSSHLPFLYVFKESKVMEKYGYEIDLHIVGGAKAPTMAHRAKLALAGEIDFLSGLHHETYRERAKGEKRLTYLAQAQNNWDDRLVALPEIKKVEDLKGRKIVCHSKAPCVSGNLRAVLQDCGLKPEEINMDVIDDTSGKFLNFVDEITSGKAVAALVDMPFDCGLYERSNFIRLQCVNFDTPISKGADITLPSLPGNRVFNGKPKKFSSPKLVVGHCQPLPRNFSLGKRFELGPQTFLDSKAARVVIAQIIGIDRLFDALLFRRDVVSKGL